MDDGQWPLPIEWQSIVNDAGLVLWLAAGSHHPKGAGRSWGL